MLTYDPTRTFKFQIPQYLFWMSACVKIDIETWEQCGGTDEMIALSKTRRIVKRNLDHLQNRGESPQPASHPVRAPPPHPELDRP